jgi:hypothetical protein
MRALCVFLLTLGLFATVHAADSVTGRVIKVLPLLLDQNGRVALSPSLFDRDAYQARLHANTNLVSGIRYDVLWSASHAEDARLTVRVELRGTGTNNLPKLKTLETDVQPGWFRTWTDLSLNGAEYREFSAITAWRATLWKGGQLLAEDKSFLW